jgi:hypothetical protein
MSMFLFGCSLVRPSFVSFEMGCALLAYHRAHEVEEHRHPKIQYSSLSSIHHDAWSRFTFDFTCESFQLIFVLQTKG